MFTEQPGIIIEHLPNAMFRVQMEDGRLVLCTMAGRMRLNRIKVLPGDRVRVEFGEYDQARGRIVYKIKS